MSLRLPSLVAILAAALVASCSNTELETRVKKLEGASPGAGGELEGRVKKLEADNTKYREMLEMIHGNFEQQRKQQEEEQANEAAPDAVFAVDVTGNQIEGPASGAFVTIIEAWDFA